MRGRPTSKASIGHPLFQGLNRTSRPQSDIKASIGHPLFSDIHFFAHIEAVAYYLIEAGEAVALGFINNLEKAGETKVIAVIGIALDACWKAGRRAVATRVARLPAEVDRDGW